MNNTRRVTIVADSVANLTPELLQQFGIHVLPVNIHFEGKIYRDGIDVTTEEAYHMLEKNPGVFATAPASIGECLEVFQNAAQDSAGVLAITLSTKLSTMYNVAKLASEQAQVALPGTRIEVLDSGTAIIGEGLIVTAAARAAIEGGTLPETVRVASAVRSKVKVFGILNTVRHVYRTGRIPELSSRLGSLLNIKPIFSISGGAVHIIGLCRSRRRGTDRIVEDMRRAVGSRPVHVAVAHGDALEEGKRLQKQIQAEFNCVENWLTGVSPVIGYSTGAGMLAVAYYTQDDDRPKI